MRLLHIALLALVPGVLQARPAVPVTLPSSTFADTETTTNIPFVVALDAAACAVQVLPDAVVIRFR